MGIKVNLLCSHSLIVFLALNTMGSKEACATPIEWTGPYAGVNLGATAMRSNHSANAPDGGLPHPELISAGAEGSTDKNGFSGGVQAGYNYAPKMTKGKIQPVIGVVADYTYFGLSADRTIGIDSDPAGVIHESTTSDWQGTVRANVGLAAGPVHLYGTGGVMLVNNNITNEVCFMEMSCNSAVSGHSTYTSGVYGIGVDYRVASNFNVGVTALWSNWNNLYQSSYGIDPEGNEIDDSLINHNTTSRIANYALRFNYKFDSTV